MAMEQTQRCFMALIPPHNVRSALHELPTLFRKSVWKPGDEPAFAPEGAGFHLTLRFLGDMTAQQVQRVKALDCFDHNSGDIMPFTLELDGLGLFYQRDGLNPSVLYAAIKGDLDTLQTLQERSDKLALEAGCPPMSFPFHPHVTLGRFTRVLNVEEMEKVHEAIGEIESKWIPEAKWEVNGGALLNSVRYADGHVSYRIISEGRFLPA